MSQAKPRAEWHWLWDAYIVGLCVAAIVAVLLLNHRFPGNVPVATTALVGIVLCVLLVKRRARQTPVFVGAVVALWVLAVWASPAAVAAVPAMYPLVFGTLPLAAAVTLTTVINVVPVTLLLLRQGTSSPNLPVAIAITL